MYLFAQLRQLSALAPYIPTHSPRLRQTAYEMVLHAFLLAPADHPRLLDALQRWPPDLYSVPSLTQSVVQRQATAPVPTPSINSSKGIRTVVCSSPSPEAGSPRRVGSHSCHTGQACWAEHTEPFGAAGKAEK